MNAFLPMGLSWSRLCLLVRFFPIPCHGYDVRCQLEWGEVQNYKPESHSTSSQDKNKEQVSGKCEHL